jgi:hypothetical protein
MFQQLALQQAKQNFWGEGNFGFGELVEGRSGSRIDWNSIINRGFDLGSQFMQSYGGKTVGTQTYGSGGQVFAVQAKPAYDDSYQYTVPSNVQTQGGGVGSTVGGGVDGIFNWLMANPLITFGGVAALYLLFREPPRRR